MKKTILAMSIFSILLSMIVIFGQGMITLYALVGITFFMSIMFPTIFAIGIQGVGRDTKSASSFLIMSIVGGAVIPPLASMITDTKKTYGKVFAKQQWNAKINAYYEAENSAALFNYFTDEVGNTTINSLENLTKVYILTSKNTASASELVINGLKPHITVVQIGDKTVGKNVGSVTLYDSPTFGTQNRNPKHRYAMQPIVLKIVNSDGFGDYYNGLQPDHLITEKISTYGVLGHSEIKMINDKEELTSNEPLLDMAFAKITGRPTNRTINTSLGKDFEFINDSKSMRRFQNEMYIEKAPEGLLKALE